MNSGTTRTSPHQLSQTFLTTHNGVQIVRCRQSDLLEFGDQMGGHSQFWTLDGGVALVKAASPHEKLVYETLAESKVFDNFLPRYYGRVMIGDEEPLVESEDKIPIAMQNICHKFRSPNMADIKIGTRTHGDGQDPEKIQRKIKRCQISTSQCLGARFAGMTVTDDGERKCWGKLDLRKLTAEGFVDQLRVLFSRNGSVCFAAVNKAMSKLSELHGAISKQKGLILYATSLLLIWEPCAHDEQDAELEFAILDFAHTKLVGDAACTDDSGFLFGLEKLRECLHSIGASSE